MEPGSMMEGGGSREGRDRREGERDRGGGGGREIHMHTHTHISTHPLTYVVCVEEHEGVE